MSQARGKETCTLFYLGGLAGRQYLGYLNSGLVGKIMGQWILDSRMYGWTLGVLISFLGAVAAFVVMGTWNELPEHETYQFRL
jgi:hypothetical protein